MLQRDPRDNLSLSRLRIPPLPTYLPIYQSTYICRVHTLALTPLHPFSQVLQRERVPVMMISQASADSSICLGIQESDAPRALNAVRAEFAAEMEMKVLALSL